MKKTLFFLFPILLLAQSEQDFSIRILQDKRVENSSELYSSLRSQNKRERELALLALANIQDTTAAEYITPLLIDRSPKVRSMAAFALGMIGKPNSTSALFHRLPVETNAECIGEILNAIGMCGTLDDLKRMIKEAESYPNEWKKNIAESIMRFANRRIKDIAATRYAAALLTDKSSLTNATYTLMRINDTLVIGENRDQLLEQTKNSSPMIRMWIATMLGVLNDSISQKKLLMLAQRDRDWRVRVNAVRALRTKTAYRNEIVNLLTDKNEHVALTAMASYDVMTVNDVQFSDSARFFVMFSSNMLAPLVQEEARKLIAKKIGERALPLIGNWISDNEHISAQRVRAFGETRSLQSIPLIKEAIQESNHSLVTIAGIESYQIIAQQADDVTKEDFLKTAVEALRKNDPGISYSAAIAFQDTFFSKEVRRIFLPELVSAFQRMNSSTDLEPMVELLNVFAVIADSSALGAVEIGLSEQDKVIRTAAEKAYTAVTGKEAPIRFFRNPNGYKPFYKINDLKLLSKYSGAEITTSKGKVKIIFEKQAAPLTVLNFILLAQKKFYDGLTFHRVVSNFVIQGGDPLGNGSGGPNYAIRTEVHPYRKYKTGAVGMASAGKDTEGSQWFITHCPTPHLDFRYTIFGYTEDSTIVDKIMVGDRIEKVVLY